MARKRPVRICIIRHRPSREPKFHQVEMLDGVGRSIRELLMILNRGWVLRMFVAIIFL